MEAGDGGEEEDVLARIQAAVSLPDVVRRYTQEVEEKGDGEYMCRCLFHEDRNPSMSVNAAKGVYHCFSCGAGGNLFKLVAEMEGLSFREAVAFLADEAGIELPRGGALGPGKDYSRLHEALEAASEYYASVLAEAPGGPARSHLRARKTSPLLAADFQLGFSPPVPGGLWEHLAPRNFTEEELVGAGLFSPRALQVLRMPPLPPPSAARGGRNATADGDNGDAAPAPAPPARRLPFDRMGGRLVIPIRNARGQMVGFSGRLLTDEPLAKYVNTPETAIFKKRTLLYGLNKARAAIRETGRAIVVEGYFDVIALHGVGVRACVRACVQAWACRCGLSWKTDGTDGLTSIHPTPPPTVQKHRRLHGHRADGRPPPQPPQRPPPARWRRGAGARRGRGGRARRGARVQGRAGGAGGGGALLGRTGQGGGAPAGRRRRAQGPGGLCAGA